MDFLNIGLAFLEGLGLIVSPCILPILPFILSGSLTGSKKRPLSIICGFIVIFAIFTFFSRKLVQYTGIDLGFIRHISYVLLFLFGLIMLSSYLTEKFSFLTRRLNNVSSNLTISNEESILSGFIFGSLVAIVWTPCAGPILAAVIVQAVLQTTTLSSFFVVLAFGIGAAVPMLLIALFGRQLMQKIHFLQTHTTLIRKLLGAIIIVAVVYMVYSESYGINSTVLFAKTDNKQNMIVDGVIHPYPAPALKDITAWINSPPLQLDQLKGKVVLIDFWTYSCINCLRTLPYLKDWYAKYHDKGFVIIGVHSPEFDFEKNLVNVQNAVTNDGIIYPVALDNQFGTWTNYQNQYWPAHYLIDKNGAVVYEHFGEGDYDITENNIRYLLGLNAMSGMKNSEAFSNNQTPETYLGFARAENFANTEMAMQNTDYVYHFPPELLANEWVLQGKWNIASDRITSAEANAMIKIHFNARKVYAVMGSANGFDVEAKLLLNGELVISNKGKDVANSAIQVNQHTLYQVLELPVPADGILQITASAPGLEMYTFTFGN